MSDFTGKTSHVLAKIVTKTPLTPKLLSKPPFRYLHDLISEIIKTTGIAQGLFNDTEMNSENIKDKDSKVAYLQKIIRCVSVATGTDISLNPLKVVAGLEPEETNRFLQILGKAAIKKVDTANAVKIATDGPEESLPHERETSANLEMSKRTGSAGKVAQNNVDLPNKKITNHTTDDPQNDVVEHPAPNEKLAIQPDDLPNDPSEKPKPDELPSALPNSRKMRPVSARPPPPKPKAQNFVEEPKRAQPIVATETTFADDDEFVVQIVDTEKSPDNNMELIQNGEQHGGLVQKILDTKKELEGPKAQVKAEKTNAFSSIDELKELIQSLCKSTHPIGKALDYLQEDVSSMNKELELWSKQVQPITAKREENDMKEIDGAIAAISEKIAQERADIIQVD